MLLEDVVVENLDLEDRESERKDRIFGGIKI